MVRSILISGSFTLFFVPCTGEQRPRCDDTYKRSVLFWDHQNHFENKACKILNNFIQKENEGWVITSIRRNRNTLNTKIPTDILNKIYLVYNYDIDLFE